MHAGRLPLRTLKIAKGLLAVAVVAASLHLIALSGIQPVDAREDTEDQAFHMSLVDHCVINGEIRYDCIRAYCALEGSECSFWEGECFHVDGGLCW